MNRHEQSNPDEFHAVEARLQEGRAQADAFALDRIKQRVMARNGAQPWRAVSMTSKLAAYLTVVVLGVGTSGAIALASKESPAGPKGGAATGQYQPGKGCGDTNHQRMPQPGQKPCPGQSGSQNH